MSTDNHYQSFLSSQTASLWKRFGARRRAGIAAPLFSIYSNKSIGIGEIPDLKSLADWCKKCGLSIIQLLPLGDVGMNFRPYDAESSFALEPMYLRLEDLSVYSARSFKSDTEALRERFGKTKRRVNYQIKQAKLDLLKKIYLKNQSKIEVRLQPFLEAQKFWIRDWALYRVLKNRYQFSSWVDWPEELRNRSHPGALARVEADHREEIRFFQWLQMELFGQMRQARDFCEKKGIYLMGDMPYLVSRDSADVWANPDYFKLNFSSGAPPDYCYQEGQKWGMPPWNWPALERDGYVLVSERLKWAENFYHLFRIDHFVGIFRLWTIEGDKSGKEGHFDPDDESVWEEHGKKILKAMMTASSMLPCAEDLGTIPECSYKVLREFSIPGLEVQRWMKDDSEHFKLPETYRPNAVSTLATHDTSAFYSWWSKETTSDEKARFWQWVGLPGTPKKKPTPELLLAALHRVLQSRSIFCIQQLQDWLSLTDHELFYDPDFRINFPGTVSDKNWNIRMPFSLEEMQKLPTPSLIRELCQATGRLPL